MESATYAFAHLLPKREFPKSEHAKHTLNKRPYVFLRWLETRVPGTDEGIQVNTENGAAPRGLNAEAIILEPAAPADGRSTRGQHGTVPSATKTGLYSALIEYAKDFASLRRTVSTLCGRAIKTNMNRDTCLYEIKVASLLMRH